MLSEQDAPRGQEINDAEGLVATEDVRPRFLTAEDAKPRFEITDAGSANWYLKKLRQLSDEKDTVKAQTEVMLKAIDADIHRLEFMYGPQLQAWVRAELARRGGRGKTLPLHQGTAAFRTIAASLQVRSAAEAMEYGRLQGWAVTKTVETLDKEAYKKQALAVRPRTAKCFPAWK